MPNIIPGFDIPRWYGVLFALGFIVSQQIMYYIYRKEGRPERDIDVLTIHMIIGVVLGARLGHCLFYDPLEYLSAPWRILMIWEGGLASHGGALGILIAVYVFVNYEIKVKYIPLIPGFIGIPKSFKKTRKKREGQSYLWVVDRLVIVVAITGAMIRTGNFMNSEIIGKPTGTDFGVVFSRSFEEILLKDKRVDFVEFEKNEGAATPQDGLAPMKLLVHYKRKSNLDDTTALLSLKSKLNNLRDKAMVREHIVIPTAADLDLKAFQEDRSWVASANINGITRHPAQLYEAVYCILLFLGIFHLWYHHRHQLPTGFLFGLFLTLLWALRFVDEFFKENQVGFEDDLALNMGQLLSIPLFLAGIAVMIYSYKNKNRKAESA